MTGTIGASGASGAGTETAAALCLIGDTHFGPGPEYLLHGHCPADHFRRLSAALASGRDKPRFIVHCGDISNRGEPESYRLAARLFAELPVPLYPVRGNHDRLEALLGGIALPDSVIKSGIEDALAYHFTSGGETFLILDTVIPERPGPLGRLSQPQIDYAAGVIDSAAGPVSVFMHHMPFPCDAPWFDRNMVIVNREAVAALFSARRDRIRGVFCGHTHRPMTVTCGGVAYSAVDSLSWQYTWRPGDEEPVLVPQEGPGYAMIHLFEDRTAFIGYRVD